MLQTLPIPSVLLSPITAYEAVLSSKIEGTQATLDEVLEADAGLITSESRRGDIEEISNYRTAVRDAEVSLAERPLSLSLIQSIHQRLLRVVLCRDITHSAFKDDPNWYGGNRDQLHTPRFFPPNPTPP